eukprot:1616866-Pleurochrysis_carterae.AAC.1
MIAFALLHMCTSTRADKRSKTVSFAYEREHAQCCPGVCVEVRSIVYERVRACTSACERVRARASVYERVRACANVCERVQRVCRHGVCSACRRVDAFVG